jgi:hypothetical protein
MSNFKWSAEGSAIVFEGTIDEFAQLPGPEKLGPAPVVDLAAVRRVNSLGVRKWIQFLAALQDRPVTLLRCSPPMVEQINCIRNFRGHASIKSVLLPYACDNCSRVNYVPLEVGPNAVSSVPDTSRCEQCGGECEFDDLPERYLSFTTAG